MGYGRSSGMDLPMSSYSSVKGGGKSIQMESPAIRAIKNASLYTKGSYFWLIFSIGLFFYGIRDMIASSGSTTLICTYTTYCTLKIKEPYGSGKKLAKIHRGQIVRSNQVEINKKGQITKFITNDGEPDINNISSDFGEATSVSYTLVLKPYHKGIGNQGEVSYNDDVAHELHPTENEMESSLEKMALELDKNNEYVILLRKYAKKKRRSSVRQQHNRLKSYILRKRKRLTVRENKSPNWFGVLSFVFGLFSTMLTALIGQFWEEDKRPFVSRRGRNQGTKRPNNYPSRSSTSGTRTSVAYGESSSRGVHTVVNRRK